MLIVLDSTSKSIRGVLGAAHTTNPVDFTVTYADSTVTSFTEASGVAQSNGTTNTEILAAPAASTQRVIKSITIWNHDTVDQTVTLYLRVTATDYGFYSESIEAGGFRFLDDLQSTAAATGGGDMVLADIQTVTGAKTFNSGKFILAGATSGTTTVNATATASGTLTLPAATDTLVGKDTTDTLTNKTLTSPVINTGTVGTSLVATTDDGAALGDSTHQFSDLHLADGAVISFNAGETTITHNTSNGALVVNKAINPTASSDLTLGVGTSSWGALSIKTGGRIEMGGDTIGQPVLTHSSGLITLTNGNFVSPNFVANTAYLPDANDGAALGTTALQFSDLFLAEGGVINWDNGDATLTQSGNDVTLAGASLTARVKPRTGSTTSSATPTINTDDVDFYELTAQAVDITSFTTNLSGTPTKGQILWIAITGTAARAITWGTGYESSTVTLPSTTVSTTRLDVGFVWNDATSKWRCVAKV